MYEGEQLELSLDDVRLKQAVVPWSGQSPRELTAAYKRFRLKTQGGGREVQLFLHVMGESCGGIPVRKKGSSNYVGASTLLPLPRRS